MSKVTTAVSKKKVKRKKTACKTSPDLLDNVLPTDLVLDSDLNLGNLEHDDFKPNTTLHVPVSYCKGGAGEGEWKKEDEPMFPHELHMTLKNQIQGLEEEKEELKLKLKQAEDKLAAASPLRNVGRASDLAANRIVELSKKIKELQSQIKIQNYTTGKKGPRGESNNGRGDVDFNGSENNEECVECVHIRSELTELNEKYNAVNIKLCELRNQNQQLRHEYKLAMKALQSEIGEKVSVPTILLSGQGWRGRAQQIIGLQQKVAELTEKLNQAQLSKSDNSESSNKEKNRQEIESLKIEIETLKTESDTMQTELCETKKKLDESRARVKSLQTEFSAIRSANAALSEKVSADKKLIESLNVQLGSLNEKTKGKESVVNNRYENQISLLKRELSQERIKNEQLQEENKEKDSKIASLQAKSAYIPRLSQSMSEEHVIAESRCLSARSASLDNSPTSSNNGNNEAERARLMELVGVNTRRLLEERKNSSILEDQLRAERHKCARLETKLARLELDRVGWSKGLYKKPSTAETISRCDSDWDMLKDKSELLEEKCLALETRIRTLQQEKEDDNRRFIQIIEEQRSSYVDSQRKQTIS